MNSPLLRAIAIAVLGSLLGSGTDYFARLESNWGLDSLFRLRGSRTPPSQTVVVAMDEESENRLGLGLDLTRWRGLHAELIKQLKAQGAALVVFDLQFIAAQPLDAKLAGAMQKAGNVLVADCVQKLRRGAEDFYGREECSESHRQAPVTKSGDGPDALPEALVAMRLIPPAATIRDTIRDHAPFFLPNDAEDSTTHEAWTFFDELAETPSLAVTAWFYYMQLNGTWTGPASGETISTWLTAKRRTCRSEIPRLRKAENTSSSPRGIEDLICRGDGRFLDFYGPPRSLRMESYADVYQGKAMDLRGKVVFVGKANRSFSPGKTDYFQTPFTSVASGKMAGVEIMATQFANLLEGRFVEAVLPHAAIGLAFGIVTACALILNPGFAGIAASMSMAAVYALFALWCFARHGLWLPVAVPLLVQLPSSWLLALAWSRRDLLTERKRLLAFARRVFPQWLPLLPDMKESWSNNGRAAVERDVEGICLATDIAGYTTLAGRHSSRKMWEMLNAYYRVLGHPVVSHDGIIADVTGDAMMAVWIDAPAEQRRLAACLAALEMNRAVAEFKLESGLEPLATRIGLYEGEMTLGDLEAGEGSHYRAIGDTVNTASRIEGVNKYLGTRVLAARSLVEALEPLYYRPVGRFGLMGRVEPVDLVEIVGLKSDIGTAQRERYQAFSTALDAFRNGHWREAGGLFQDLLNEQYDGPSRFYLNLARDYQKNPDREWTGVVNLSEK